MHFGSYTYHVWLLQKKTCESFKGKNDNFDPSFLLTFYEICDNTIMFWYNMY